VAVGVLDEERVLRSIHDRDPRSRELLLPRSEIVAREGQDVAGACFRPRPPKLALQHQDGVPGPKPDRPRAIPPQLGKPEDPAVEFNGGLEVTNADCDMMYAHGRMVPACSADGKEYVPKGDSCFMTSPEPIRLQLGGQVPNFELAVYDPVKNDFGKISLDEIKSQGKWTILFFYPADFTFV